MRKYYLLALISLLGVIPVLATDFTDYLTVNVNGSISTQKATISVLSENDSTVTLSLNNFVLKASGSSLGVGNITLQGVKAVRNGSVTSYTSEQTIKIDNGNDPDITTWIGPMLPPVPVDLKAEQRDTTLYAVIDIDMSASLQQKIQVVFGDGGYQIPGSGFEDYESYTLKSLLGSYTVQEPRHWHSFASAGGDFAAAANLFSSNPHTYPSDLVRPGSAGKRSVLVVASKAAGIVANGTITTGRMNAGAMDPADTKNHAEIDMSKTEKDAAGDPYYAVLNGQPDSLSVWVKFKQGTPQADYPYATVSAAITDSSYYQDPQDKTYTNVLAMASNAKISSEDFQWQKISIPFTYINDNVKGHAILVTISTNAGPGKGSATDSLYVDDVELIYNSGLSSVSVKGKNVALTAGTTDYTVEGAGTVTADDITAVADGRGARVIKSIAQNGSDAVATVKVVSGDLKSTTTYRFILKDAVTGISKVNAGEEKNEVKALYDTDGRLLGAEPEKGVFIRLYKSGKTEKVVK